MANRQTETPDDVLSYYVSTGRGEDFVLQIKASWKLTFGAVNPGGQMSGRDMHCLRIWEGEKMRAVFCDVRGFRDLSLPLARKVSSETGTAEWKQDSNGNFEASERRAIETSWEEPANLEDIPF
jgi:hypothetical protein